MEKNVIITIGRQYGSGGKTIGKIVARELGIPYYDREVIRLASEDSGIAEYLFNQVDEFRKKSIRDIFRRQTYNPTLMPPESSEFISQDNLFNYQAKVIRELAEEGSCVFIGRCADDILKDRDDLLRVFIYADEAFCLEKAHERNSMSDHEMRNFIKKVDKYRGDFYKYYTGREWTDARNYDLCLNTGVLGFEKCVQIIKEYIGVRFE